MLVDLRKLPSAEKLREWKDKVKEEQCGTETEVYLIGVRLDEVTPIKIETVEQRLERMEALALLAHQVSAKDGEGVREMFDEMSQYRANNDVMRSSLENSGFF
jgi:hypothetical protein